MTDIKKIAAILCALLFVITATAAIFLFNIQWRAFSAETYKAAFERLNLYERMPAILANALYASTIQNGNTDPFLQVMTVEDWEVSIASLLPPEELKVLSEGTIDSLFSYLNNETDSVVIPLEPIKRQLAGPQGAAVVMSIIQAQPECTAQQLLQIGLGLFTGDIALCRPPEEMMGFFTPLIESQIQSISTAMPNEITVLSNTASGTAEDPRLKLNTTRAWMSVSPILPLLFLAGILILAVRSFADWLKWWGWPFFATGLSVILITLVGSPILALVIRGVIASQIGSMSPILASTLLEMVSAVSFEIMTPIAVQGLVLGLAGLAMVGCEY
jgi:hypothetical protein